MRFSRNNNFVLYDLAHHFSRWISLAVVGLHARGTLVDGNERRVEHSYSNAAV